MGSELGAIGSGGDFKGFDAADFDAYEKKKWSSNAYTLARRTAKDKLLSLARAVAGELEEDLEFLELGASEEAPSVANNRTVRAQWVFFTRSADQREALKPFLGKTDLASGASLFDISVQHQHACLLVRLDYTGISVGVEIATKAKVDRDNAAEKLQSERARNQFVELCKSLPGGATVGFSQAPALELSESEVQDWIEPLGQGELPFVAEVGIKREEELLGSEGLIGTVAQYVSQFAPIFKFLSWSKDNDHTKVTGAIQQEKEVRKKASPGFKAGDRVIMTSGLFAGRPGYVAEIDTDKGKAKVMVGPVSVSVDVGDLKAS